MWRPRRAGVLAALCALRVASGGIVVLAPEASATGRDELLATSLRFFGKRHFERNITGEVVKLYVQQQCDRRILPRPPVLEGAIVVLDDLCLDAYARMALVSIQEFFGFSYTSFKAQLAIYELGPAAVVLVATFFYASSMKLMPF